MPTDTKKISKARPASIGFRKDDGRKEIITKALEVALYYGFSPHPAPKISRADIELAKKAFDTGPKWRPAGPDGSCGICESAEEKVAILRTYAERGMIEWPQPVMLAFEGAIRGARGEKANPREYHFHLEIIGTKKSIAEAILMKATYDILREEGFADLYIDINTLGDKDSAARYAREIGNYYRKRSAELTPKCREAVKKNPFDVSCDDPQCRPIHDDAPPALAYLSEASRQHFREVLEYLESTSIPYRINPRICGERSMATHTTFEVKSLPPPGAESTDPFPLAFGVRYDSLAKRIGWKSDVPAIGATIAFRRGPDHAQRSPVILKRPKVFFIQLGFEAKLKSLSVIEILRGAKIPVLQALPKDKFASQLATAEELGIPFTIIFGQKEALEGTVIIRNMSNRSQDTVSITELPAYLRRIR